MGTPRISLGFTRRRAPIPGSIRDVYVRDGEFLEPGNPPRNGYTLTAPRPIPYSGRQNLEVMEAARAYNAYLAALVRQGAPEGGRILDFGAGTGRFSDAVSGPANRIVCVEADDELRNGLAARGFEAYPALADVAPESCDFAFTLNVLEHIEDHESAVAGLWTALKPGAALLVYVPAMNVLFSAMDRNVGHVRRYGRRELVDLLRSQGFEVQYARYADCLGFFATLLFKTLGDEGGVINERGLILYDRLAFPVSRLLDRVCHPFFGKNLVARATKQGHLSSDAGDDRDAARQSR